MGGGEQEERRNDTAAKTEATESLREAESSPVGQRGTGVGEGVPASLAMRMQPPRQEGRCWGGSRPRGAHPERALVSELFKASEDGIGEKTQ